MPHKHLTYTCRIILVLAFWVLNTVAFAQENTNNTINEEEIQGTDKVSFEQLNISFLEQLLFEKLNMRLSEKNLNTFMKDSLLKAAAKDHAQYMAFYNKATLEQETKHKHNTAERLVYVGGSIHGEEIVSRNNLNKNGQAFTYNQIADDIVLGWFTSKKKATLLEGGQYNLIGLSVKEDRDFKRIYTSTVLGNFKTHNIGSTYKNELPIPYSVKNFGLKSPDLTVCKKVNRSEKLNQLHQKLLIEDDIVYLETENIKEISKFLKNKKDGLAIEFLQQEQFPCNLPNIVDHNLSQTGIISKKLYQKKLFKSNIADLEENKKAFKAQIATVPAGISENYETNLIFIQDKHFCRSISQNFIIQTNGTYTRAVKLLADTVNINSRFDYIPTPDTSAISIRVPFENNQANYQLKDIDPFIQLLNEPAFLIYDIKITAYSSVEGNDEENKKLQRQRANSILNALENRHTDSIKTEIITNYNRADFDNDIKQSKHNALASLNIEEIQEYIRKNKLKDELEPMLSEHRYAQIDMQIISDISGKYEQSFVTSKFNEAVEMGDRALALSIEKYIMKQISQKRYTADAISKLSIPDTEDYAGLQMNKAWLMYKTKQLELNDFYLETAHLYDLNSTNEYIAFNHLFLQITQDSIEVGNPMVQTRIERLYFTPLQKLTVDALNIRYQFILLDDNDALSKNPKLKEQTVKRIKQIVDIKDETLENSLKLAELFIENNDYPFAIKTLEPWLRAYEAGEKLYYTYLSLCSQYEYKMHTQRFNYAIKRAQELNPQRFCELFNGDYFSLRVLENQVVKESYCSHCEN